MPLFLAALFMVRALPALLYRSQLGTRRGGRIPASHVAAVHRRGGADQATSRCAAAPTAAGAAA
ncbi:MAG TPA: hypothetical protein VE673_18095 [Pseudonocardiaceae bacterium]|nr:hypothetical protein [Pseudonocardiaceae bacterium]